MSDKLSAVMLLDGLQDQCNSVESAEAVLRSERATRDSMIRDLISVGIPYKRVQAITGLSRDRVYTIVNTPASRQLL